jgi:hypothetical protein
MSKGYQILVTSGAYFFTVQVVDWVDRKQRNLKVIESLIQIDIMDI